MSETYTIGQAAKLLKPMAPETLRRYLARYPESMSPGANPEPGETRELTREDIQLVAYARDRTREGMNQADIAAALATIEEEDLPPWDTLILSGQGEQLATGADYGATVLPLLEALASNKEDRERIDGEIVGLRAKLEEAERERKALKGELEQLRHALEESKPAPSFWDRLFGRGEA